MANALLVQPLASWLHDAACRSAAPRRLGAPCPRRPPCLRVAVVRQPLVPHQKTRVRAQRESTWVKEQEDESEDIDDDEYVCF
jgi:hypothetical protein